MAQETSLWSIVVNWFTAINEAEVPGSIVLLIIVLVVGREATAAWLKWRNPNGK